MRVLAQNSGNHADAEHDEREADEALRPVVQPLGQAEVQLENRNAECRHGKGMAQGVRHA